MNLPDYSYERRIWKIGKLPAGVDEAGRGPLAGPVVAAAVILPKECEINGLNDSKKLSHQKREILYHQIKAVAVSIGVGIIEPDEIDRINILRAALLAMEIAVKKLNPKPDFLLIDGNIRTSLLIPQQAVIGGDSTCNSIAAASIIAKVARDLIMYDYHNIHPEYNFKKHKGYPTKEHYEALRKFGPCPIHRKTFKGVIWK
ncbi:MAG: ribonuclease HII, ribonuclease HII [Candidatus Dadabacteria bacterium CSP1-2]|nr:MAG: ribonuclease HII, ribonuclease HII [Candidatus Dadabacteria bacterium CSP1-2]OGE23478.1 MAG: ribonuclease HII [Candidatus Dadabacteria bacterium RBG_19FT_COMBO_40_33]